jgi:glycosyltransferase involved in cell wall biosynthesis
VLQGKSVLFVQGRFTVGGVERVTILLANALARRGWRVGIAIFQIEQDNMLRLLSPEVVVREIGAPVYSLKSISKLKALMRELNTTHIINQWAFPYPVTFMLRRAMPKKARLISVYHTMPNRNKRALEATGIKRKMIELLLRINSRFVYQGSHAYVVLSDVYKDIFKEFVKIRTAPKLYAIPNPLTPVGDVSVNKDNVILYVGRLTLTEKRVDRVISAWKLISDKLPGWRLEILGDGPDRVKLENDAASLERIRFVGFQSPEMYYAKAKILLLTSDFEGFPMTLIEAMSLGCVPVVYESFPVAKEIVSEDCGVVVPRPWNDESFAEAVTQLTNNQNKLELFAKNGKEFVKRFNIDTIVNQYLSVMEH